MVSENEKLLLRELAKRYREIAESDAQSERIRRIRNINGCRPDRPVVWIDEIPWFEMDIDGQLQLKCEDETAKEMERFFRRMLFRWKYFQADMVFENSYSVNKSWSSSGNGLAIKEDTVSTSDQNHIVSHHYEDQLDTFEKVERLKTPVVTAFPDKDKANAEIASDILGDILPVRYRGTGIHFAPWDEIARFRGIEPILLDMMERPELLHRTMEKYTEFGLSQMEQMENLGLLDYGVTALHCTPPYVDDLPRSDYAGGKVRLKDVWFRGMAQMFSSASPAMRDEFDLRYMRKMMEKCGLVYYGCCEPLDRSIPYLKKIPNMRKIGVSPWANVQSSAEQIQGDYVFARKPNPALVAGGFDAEEVRRETKETIEACQKYGCAYEFVLKDISTVSNNPQNLISWNETVQQTINEYY
jgi:hypothetical protein